MKKTILLLSSFAAIASTASAQILLTYDFEGDFSAKSVDSALITSATDFGNSGAASLTSGNNPGTLIGPGTDAAGTAYTLGTRDEFYGQSNGYSATFDGTNANGLYGANTSDYVGFSFTADTAFDLDAIDFDMAQGGSSGPRGFTVTYNLNGGSFSTLGVAALDVGSSGQFGHYSFDFGSLSLAATDTVEVRLLGFSTGTGNSVRFDNVAVTAVPEPGTYAAIAGLMTLGLALWRRHRRG